MKIQLKINGEWAVLPPDFSLKMMKTSPLFSDQGDFSYPFELPVEQNRHIFGPIADPMGFVRLREFHAIPAEIWFEGNQVFVGQTEISGEQTFSQRGKVSFNVVSNNGAFKDMISGLNCRDVKLKDQILLGWRPYRMQWSFDRKIPELRMIAPKDGATPNSDGKYHLSDLMVRTANIEYGAFDFEFPKDTIFTTNINVSKQYPQHAFCNVRLCSPRGAGQNSTLSDNSTGNGYSIYPADWKNAAPSFFVMYFLDCLFDKKNLDIIYDNKLVVESDVQDINRLAFLNTASCFDDKDERKLNIKDLFVSSSTPGKYYPVIESFIEGKIHVSNYMIAYDDLVMDTNLWYKDRIILYNAAEHNVNCFTKEESIGLSCCNCYANGDNFPDVEVSKVIEDLTNAFGIVFDYNQELNYMKSIFIKDIMRDNDVENNDCVILDDIKVSRPSTNGIILTFNGDEDDINYNYNMPTGKDKYGNDDPVVYDNYLSIISNPRSQSDTITKYDKSTGNAYRIKVNEDTGKEPQFFSAGSYRDYKIGIVKEHFYRNHNFYNDSDENDTASTKPHIDRDESNADTISINFKPVTINDTWSFEHTENIDVIQYPTSHKDQSLAVFVDVEGYNTSNKVYLWDIADNGSMSKTSNTEEMLSSTSDFVELKYTRIINGIEIYYDIRVKFRINGDAAYDLSSNEHPLRSARIGYQLGFMRGPGNDSGDEIVSNYDDEGNASWYEVNTRPVFSADSVDLYGKQFDYNGKEEGLGDEWNIKHVTVNESLQQLKMIFTKSNVPFDGARASRYVYFVNKSQAVVRPSFNYLCSLIDKDGIVLTENEVADYMIDLESEIGLDNLTKIYDVDKLRKGILVFVEYGRIVERYVNSYRSLIKVYSSGKDGDALVKVDPLEGRLSLKLDARKVKEYDDDGNPVYFDVTDNAIARRGLVPQLLEDFLYFKAHHVKVTIPVLMSLSAINNLQLLKWNRFGDYVGLIKQVNYELTESGLRDVTVELLVANK